MATIDLSRRGFVGAGMGMGALAAAGALRALADEKPAGNVVPSSLGGSADAEGEVPMCEFTPGGGSFAEGALPGWDGTPPEIEAVGGSTMPLAELNRRRHAYYDAAEDYVKEDGTVVPAWAVKIRRVVHAYGMGYANTPFDTTCCCARLLPTGTRCF